MTEKEMMNQMQNLLGIRKKPSEKEAAAIALADSVDELAEMFCDSAIVLSRIASLIQGKKNPWDTKNFEDMDGWDGDDMACMDATVLFAVPCKPVQLMTEEEALSKFPGFDDEQTFYCVEIGDHLFLHYMEHTWESEEDITITAPVCRNLHLSPGCNSRKHNWSRFSYAFPTRRCLTYVQKSPFEKSRGS